MVLVIYLKVRIFESGVEAKRKEYFFPQLLILCNILFFSLLILLCHLGSSFSTLIFLGFQLTRLFSISFTLKSLTIKLRLFSTGNCRRDIFKILSVMSFENSRTSDSPSLLLGLGSIGRVRLHPQSTSSSFINCLMHADSDIIMTVSSSELIPNSRVIDLFWIRWHLVSNFFNVVFSFD
jgi:hypothetical protein